MVEPPTLGLAYFPLDAPTFLRPGSLQVQILDNTAHPFPQLLNLPQIEDATGLLYAPFCDG